ncbi:MAG: alpha-glucan family phosphorylase [Solirubrobacteraceae bacterium]
MARSRFDGQRDIARAADSLATRLPDPLAGLARLAYNYGWSWQAGGEDLFRSIDPPRWQRVGANPVRLLQEASGEALARAADDQGFVARVEAAVSALAAELAREPPAATSEPTGLRAFFCAEFAVHVSLPIYSGGLGALAGDFLKQASDDAMPMVGVGLLYRQGYFRQRVDAGGLQHEYWVDSDPERLPAALVTGGDGAPVTVVVPIAGEPVSAQIWRVDVGRVPLFLLDSDVAGNTRAARWIASRLYVGAPELRLAQYLLLGVGGVRALEAMGLEATRLHLNEGHAAFAAIELAGRELAAAGGVELAIERIRPRLAFTTHTPVPAGNDSYPVEQVVEAAGAFAEEVGIGAEAVVRLGRTHPAEAAEPFGITQLALRTSSTANGVSQRHGEVAREMWAGLWPGLRVEQVPIVHVTNGVHLPTWLGAPMRSLLDRHLPSDWLSRAAEPDVWDGVDAIPARELWAARNEQRAALVARVLDRSVAERLGRGDAVSYARAAEASFDPAVLTIGFARRLATYKRLQLLVADRDGARELLRGKQRVQIVLAGKAHPRDDDGKRMLQDLFQLKEIPEVAERVVFLDDYDLASAALLVQGCDVWVNVPRPPLEASGTSGMKSAVNGGLQLSVLDGWWVEGYRDGNGWALPGNVDQDELAQDARDGAELQRLLREQVVPVYYDRGADGLPHAWLETVRASLRSLGPQFSAQRMLRDYRERVYRD